MSVQSTRLEIAPASLTIPTKPILDHKWAERRLVGDHAVGKALEICGLESAPISPDQATRLFREKYSSLKRAIEDGDRKSIQKITAEHPALMSLPDIKEVLARWMKNRSLRRSRGRPCGSGTWSPVFVAAIVDFLILTGKAGSKEQAFAQLLALGIHYDTAKRLDAQARRELRFHALLASDEHLARPLDAKTYSEISQAERLLPGTTVVRQIDAPALGGKVRIEFTARSPHSTR